MRKYLALTALVIKIAHFKLNYLYGMVNVWNMMFLLFKLLIQEATDLNTCTFYDLNVRSVFDYILNGMIDLFSSLAYKKDGYCTIMKYHTI